MTPKAVLHSGGKGTVKRCEYFIKCCNCSELLSARDFPEHTGELDCASQVTNGSTKLSVCCTSCSYNLASNPADLTPLATKCSCLF